jgi:hypothetical protein
VFRNALDLDIELAAGAVPSSSPELAQRTEQLLRWHRRTQLAQQLAQMARALPDHQMAEEMYRLAARVSRVSDRDVVPVATASCLVQENRFQHMPVEHHLRPDEEARLLLRGSSPL